MARLSEGLEGSPCSNKAAHFQCSTAKGDMVGPKVKCLLPASKTFRDRWKVRDTETVWKHRFKKPSINSAHSFHWTLESHGLRASKSLGWGTGARGASPCTGKPPGAARGNPASRILITEAQAHLALNSCHLFHLYSFCLPTRLKGHPHRPPPPTSSC